MTNETYYANGTPRPVPRIQLAKIQRVLKRDADAHRLIYGKMMEYVDSKDRNSAACKSAGRCSVGALMFAVPSIPLNAIVEATIVYRTKHQRALRRAFGLLPHHISAIISINDGTDDDANNGKRYDEVMALLTFVEWAQRAGIRFVSGNAITDAYGDEADFRDY